MTERQARIEAALTAHYLHYKSIARYPANRITWAECVERYPDDAADERGAMSAALDAADAVGRQRVSVERDDLENILGWIDTVDDCSGRGLDFDAIQRLNEALLTAAPAEPSMTKLDKDAEAAIEAARNLLLHLHLETMTGATLTTPAVQELMTALDDAIFAWDESKPPQDDESRWHVWTPERGHDETGEKP